METDCSEKDIFEKKDIIQEVFSPLRDQKMKTSKPNTSIIEKYEKL